MSAVYLDIETTSLDPRAGEITVVGLCIERGESCDFIQMVEESLDSSALIEHVRGHHTLYTYNGDRFDLPYIKVKLGVDLAEYCIHRDLMHDCHRHGLYGGMKRVERTLGIGRELNDVSGIVAVRLWQNYKLWGCRESLEKLLRYNREDVLNLRALRQKLNA
ncbi:MAG: ribonuclease H-like domain-containing protein [bacterium]|jgi:hypothetical protein